MNVDRLVLEQFRSYEHLDLHIPASGLRLHGRNASGKTSVLEALVLLSTTRSPRAAADRELVRWGSGADLGVPAYALIEAHVRSSSGAGTVGVAIELDPGGANVARKTYRINGEARRAHDTVGVLKCVLFSPEDVVLVTGAPVERRRQVDILLSQTDRRYLAALAQYGRVLTQRNRLLRQFARERRSHRDRGAVTELSFWDEHLVAAGATVVSYRHMAALRISELVDKRSATLVDGASIGFAYVPRLTLQRDVLSGEPDEDRAVVAALFDQQLTQARQDEFRRGMSLVGPHRDDFAFLIEQQELATYGSRGQQRLGVVAYKLAEIDIIDERTGERPVLLLDDVLSELDAVHRGLLIADIAACGCQMLVTSTDADVLDHEALRSLLQVEVSMGSVVPTRPADPGMA